MYIEINKLIADAVGKQDVNAHDQLLELLFQMIDEYGLVLVDLAFRRNDFDGKLHNELTSLELAELYDKLEKIVKYCRQREFDA